MTVNIDPSWKQHLEDEFSKPYFENFNNNKGKHTEKHAAR